MVLKEAPAAAPWSGGQKVPVTLNHESKRSDRKEERERKKSNFTLRHQENDGQASERLEKILPSFSFYIITTRPLTVPLSRAQKIRDSFFFLKKNGQFSQIEKEK